MSIGKTVVKLAAAAFVVAGLTVGTAVAQLPTASQASDKMSVTYIIDNVAEIVCIPKDPSDVELLANAAANVTVTDTKMADPGTLGQIKVTTNSAGWDINMSTLYGGKLVYATDIEYVDGGCPTGQDDPWNPGGCLVPLPQVPSGGTQNALTYNTFNSVSAAGIIGGTAGKDPDTLQLQVAIGVGKIGAELASSGPVGTTVYMYGAPTTANILPPVLIPFAALSGSKAVDIDGSAVTPVAISFAQTLGNAYYGMAANYPQNFDTKAWADIETSGFAKPSWQPATSTSKGNDAYFFVNVGLLPSLADKLGGNTKGTYTEEFTFELLANF